MKSCDLDYATGAHGVDMDLEYALSKLSGIWRTQCHSLLIEKVYRSKTWNCPVA